MPRRPHRPAPSSSARPPQHDEAASASERSTTPSDPRRAGVRCRSSGRRRRARGFLEIDLTLAAEARRKTRPRATPSGRPWRSEPRARARARGAPPAGRGPGRAPLRGRPSRGSSRTPRPPTMTPVAPSPRRRGRGRGRPAGPAAGLVSSGRPAAPDRRPATRAATQISRRGRRPRAAGWIPRGGRARSGTPEARCRPVEARTRRSGSPRHQAETAGAAVVGFAPRSPSASEARRARPPREPALWPGGDEEAAEPGMDGRPRARVRVGVEPRRSSAPSIASKRSAAASDSGGGASNQPNARGSALPQAWSASTVAARSTRWTSGDVGRGHARAARARDQSRTHRPGPVRPARPARWVGRGLADPAQLQPVEPARGVVAGDAGQAAVDHRRRRRRSSATSRRCSSPGRPSGGSAGRSARSCSSAGSDPCSGQDGRPSRSGRAARAAPRDPADLLRPRQEDEDVSPVGLDPGRATSSHRRGATDSGCAGRGGRSVVDLDRERPPLDPDDRAAAQEPRDRLGVERGRHHDQDQVVADRLAGPRAAGRSPGRCAGSARGTRRAPPRRRLRGTGRPELPVEDPLGLDPEPGRRADPRSNRTW